MQNGTESEQENFNVLTQTIGFSFFLDIFLF